MGSISGESETPQQTLTMGGESRNVESSDTRGEMGSKALSNRPTLILDGSARGSNLNTIPSVHGADSIREKTQQENELELSATQPSPDLKIGAGLASPELDSDEEENPTQ